MQIKVFLSAYNIDDFRKKWVVRSLFLIFIAIGTLIRLYPLGNPDPTAILDFSDGFLTDPSKYNDLINADNFLDLYIERFGDFYLYAFEMIALQIVHWFIAIVFAGVYIRDKRSAANSPRTCSAGTLVKRCIALCAFTIVVSPFILIVYSQFYFVCAFAVGILGFFVGSYVSGDFSFGRSFSNTFRMFKQALLTMALNYIIFYLLFYFLDLIVTMLDSGGAYQTILAVLGASFATLKYLILGRLMGTNYVSATGELIVKRDT